MNEHRYPVAGEHDVELDAAQTKRGAKTNRREGVLWRQRATATMREDVWVRPAH